MTNKPLTSAIENELHGLREQSLDQGEQINVLLSEITRLRNEKASYSSAEQSSIRGAKDEIRRLQSEVDNLQQRLKQQQQQQQQQKVSFSEQRDQRFEPSVEGGISTSTPVDFQSSDRFNKLVTQKVSEVRSQYEREFALLKDQLADAHAEETLLRSRLNELERHVESCERESKISSERMERMRSDSEQASLTIEELHKQLQVAREEVAHAAALPLSDAHTWWSYVWHESNKRQESSQRDSDRLEYDDLGEESDGLDKAKRIARQQAIEITNFRQVITSTSNLLFIATTGSTAGEVD